MEQNQAGVCSLGHTEQKSDMTRLQRTKGIFLIWDCKNLLDDQWNGHKEKNILSYQRVTDASDGNKLVDCLIQAYLEGALICSSGPVSSEVQVCNIFQTVFQLSSP